MPTDIIDALDAAEILKVRAVTHKGRKDAVRRCMEEAGEPRYRQHGRTVYSKADVMRAYDKLTVRVRKAA